RDISRQQAKILRDDAGRYFIQDLSHNGTRVNGSLVYGTLPLQDGDVLKLGDKTELTFEMPEGSQMPTSGQSAPVHPRAQQAAPLQAEQHPVFSGMKDEEIAAYLKNIGDDIGPDFSRVRAARVVTPDQIHLFLDCKNTGWVLGQAEKVTGNTKAISFLNS